MDKYKIKQSEVDLLSAAINKIISSEVLEDAILDRLPLTNDLTDSNKIHHGKVSVLFADMRESTKLPEKFSVEQLVKIYRGYIRAIVQAVRYSGGAVRDFMGDGILGVFIDDERGKSEDKAVQAGRYITTAIDMFLNPMLEQAMKYRISCGIGIHTGEVSLSKGGMRGKDQQDDAENEYGIVWIGNSTNFACKFSGAVDSGTIFISPSTYSALSDIGEKQHWQRIKITKGSNVLDGYIAKHYYLQVDTQMEPYPADSIISDLSLEDKLRGEYQKQLAEIARNAEDLGKKEQDIQARENKLKIKNAEIDQKEKDAVFEKQRLKREKYAFHCAVLGSGHCKKDYVLAMGEQFWEEHLANAIEAGLELGKSEDEVKQKVSYTMVSIYGYFEQYDKAYDFLVAQAKGYAWLNLSVVQNIVRKVGYAERLKSALYHRLTQNDLSDENKCEFEKIKNWLVFGHI